MRPAPTKNEYVNDHYYDIVFEAFTTANAIEWNETRYSLGKSESKFCLDLLEEMSGGMLCDRHAYSDDVVEWLEDCFDKHLMAIDIDYISLGEQAIYDDGDCDAWRGQIAIGVGNLVVE